MDISMNTVMVSFSDGQAIISGHNCLSSVRPPSKYSFVPGDEVFIYHPNSKTLQHSGKVGIIQDKYTKNNRVWVKFSDGSRGAVDPVAFVPNTPTIVNAIRSNPWFIL